MANIEAREEKHSTENKQHQGRHVERARDDGAGIDRRWKSRTVGADVDDPVSQERKADARGDDESLVRPFRAGSRESSSHHKGRARNKDGRVEHPRHRPRKRYELPVLRHSIDESIGGGT